MFDLALQDRQLSSYCNLADMITIHTICYSTCCKIEKKCNVKCVFWVVARLLQRLKPTFLEIFSSLLSHFRARSAPLEIFSKNVNFSLWGKQRIVPINCTFLRIIKICAGFQNPKKLQFEEEVSKNIVFIFWG